NSKIGFGDLILLLRYFFKLKVSTHPNLGGYTPQAFGELHSYHLVVAPDAVSAKQLGKQFIDQEWHKPHTDRVVDIDDCIPIDHIAGRYIQLVQGEFNPTRWENTYLLL
ncbi:hypothetical protein RJC92_16585, partial [Acinetobacter nosocomialis]|nr:hypothetical protein [Acinetobacter nosocomialis]